MNSKRRELEDIKKQNYFHNEKNTISEVKSSLNGPNG